VVSIVDRSGTILLRSLRISPDPGLLTQLLTPFSHLPKEKVHMVYEAGCFGFWLAQKLQKMGYSAIVTPPTMIPVQSGNKIKTDKRDSQKLALYLSKGLLKGVYIPEREVLFDREWTRTREQLVKHRATIEHQIKSKLLLHGDLHDYSHHGAWSLAWIRKLRSGIKGSPLAPIVEVLLNARQALVEQIQGMNKKICFLSKEKRYQNQIVLLTSVPGIGRLSALKFILELGNQIDRFKNGDSFVANIGLTPSEYSSGPHVRQGKITRSGNKRLRSLLVEASWLFIRKNQKMYERYEEIKKRRGSKKAIVGTARRLAQILRRIILDNQPYQEKMFKNEVKEKFKRRVIHKISSVSDEQ